MELLEHPITVALLVVVSTWVAVVQSMAHRVIEEGHNFACSGGDGLGLSNSGGQAPVESAECGMRSPDGHGGPSQMGGNASDRFSGVGRENLSAADLAARRETSPGSTMFGAGPSALIGPAFRDQT